MPICRLCRDHVPNDGAVKYGVRHYAHFACYLDNGRSLADLKPWQVGRFPYRMLKERGLTGEAERLTRQDGAR